MRALYPAPKSEFKVCSDAALVWDRIEMVLFALEDVVPCVEAVLALGPLVHVVNGRFSTSPSASPE